MAITAIRSYCAAASLFLGENAAEREDEEILPRRAEVWLLLGRSNLEQFIAQHREQRIPRCVARGSRVFERSFERLPIFPQRCDQNRAIGIGLLASEKTNRVFGIQLRLPKQRP